MMWYLVKKAAQTETGIGAIDRGIQGITAGVEGIAGALPIVPVPAAGGGLMMAGAGTAREM